MSSFYTGRHRAARTSTSAAHRAGVGVLAATALGMGVTTMTATSAAAQGGPTTQSSSSSASSTSGSTTFTDVVERGDSGSTVEEIQEQVDAPVDGVFGSETEAAVEDFQGENGLAVDGVVGPETGSAMGLDGNASVSSASTGEASDAGSSDSGASTSGASTYGASSVSSGTAADSSVVETARGLIGSPYVMGGTDPSGFDCSGLVQYVYAKHGKDLPRTAQEQLAAATPVSDPQPGDIVFFGDGYHNGIYAGDGKIIDAGNPGTGVSERDIWTDDVSYGRF